MDIKIKEITLILGFGEDQLKLELDLPTTHPEMCYAVTATIRARQGYGETWCQGVLGRYPDRTVGRLT